MSPPTIPSSNSPASIEIANIIVMALRDRGYDAGIKDRTIANQWEDFDIIVLWSNLTIGSKRRNRSYLQVTWDKRIIKFSIFGRRWEMNNSITPSATIIPDPAFEVNLADPNSLNKIVDFITKVAIEDKYGYPFL